MLNQQDSYSAQNLSKLEILSQEIDLAEKVKETVDTQGWREILGPMLDKMIIDVLGGLENGRWHNGCLGSTNAPNMNSQELIAYKTALIDLHSHIYSYVDRLEESKQEYKNIMAEEKNPQYKPVSTQYAEDWSTE